MTHAWFLRIVEARHHGLPALYIAPVWACTESLEAVPPADAPHQGLDGLAFRFVYDLVDELHVGLGAMSTFMGLADFERQRLRLIETHQALATLDAGATYGQKCAAWAEAFGMAGVIVERSPTDFRCGAMRSSRCVRATVNAYVEEWLARHQAPAAVAMPAVAGVATNVRLLRPEAVQ